MWIALAIFTGVWANNWGRNFSVYFLISLILTPILAAFILLIKGKQARAGTIEQKVSMARPWNNTALATKTNNWFYSRPRALIALRIIASILIGFLILIVALAVVF